MIQARPSSTPQISVTTTEMMAAIQAMDDAGKKELDSFLLANAPIWVPQDGPQLMAYLSEADILFYGGAAGGGKGLALDTPIPTTTGWKMMGDLQKGDEIFDQEGKPCRVTAVSEVSHKPCFRLRFDDGSSIVADDVHRWVTFDADELASLTRKSAQWRALRREKRPSRAGSSKSDSFRAAIAARNSARAQAAVPILPTGTMRDTGSIYDTLRTTAGRANHAIPVCKPLECEQTTLIVPPYTLGAWLGDGASRSGQLTSIDQQIWRRIEADGFEVRHYECDKIQHNIIGLKVLLREIGVLGNKHIPTHYLRASLEQRMALLQGLMDTDGHAALDGGAEFDSTNERLALGLLELVRSIGIKATLQQGFAKLNGRIIGPKWRVRFTTAIQVFGLDRKAARIKSTVRRTAHFRYLVDCQPVESVPTRCIAVDSPTHQYLAGSAMVPTHNTDLLLGLCLTSQEHTIIFRREAVQLTGIEERMTKILGTRKGYNSQDGVWRLPDGKVMELGSVKEPGDWIKYQGRPHDAKCVGLGTPVLMADGAYKAIESIALGDMVATLEGPKAVTKTFVMRKQAVTAIASVNGKVVAKQVQSRSHRVLASCGWVCRDMLKDHDVSSPTQPRSACISEDSSLLTSGQTSSIPQGKYSGSGQQQERQQGREGCQSPLGSCAGEAVLGLGIGFAKSVYRLSTTLRHSLKIALQALLRPFAELLALNFSQPCAGHGATYALSASSLADCQGDCLSGPRRDGEQPHGALAHAPQCLLLQDGVVPQSPKHFGVYAQDKTHGRSRRVESYVHPYTKEIRQIQVELSEASLQFLDAGEQDLFDITVDDANNYITAGGFVNSNCFDEICHFTESQFRTLIGWLRTDKPHIRQRVVAAGNPPTTAEGEWVKRYWAAWLDPSHPNPAKPGELRWYVSDEKGDDREVPSCDPVMVGSDLVKPKSRTFIPSSVDDNLFLLSTGYKETLRSLPEPLRSQMLRGDFAAGAADPAWQTIPTDWVKAAQARWTDRQIKGPMTAIGFDPARGGIDKSSIARRHGQWFDRVITAPGAVTKDGPTAAAFVVPYVRDGACVCVDSIGIGSSALDFMVGLNLHVFAVNGSEASHATTIAGNLRYRNKRAEMYWRLREALDPTNPDPIALPPDAELLGDLTAVRYKVVTMGKVAALQMRDKDEIREMLGRSPDKGDAVAMTFVGGIPAANVARNQYHEPPPADWRL